MSDCTTIVPRPSGLTKAELAGSRLYPNIKTREQAAVVIAKAKSFGVCPTVVAENLFFVGGKPSLSAHLIASLVKKSGRYDYRVVEKTDKQCVIDFFEITPAGREKIGREVFTLQMAQRASLASGVNWKKYPEAMLWARCLTAGVRAHCPDALGGTPVYSVEELAPSTEVDAEGRPMIEDVQDAEIITPGLTPAQLAELEALLASSGADKQTVLDYCAVTELAAISPDDFDRVCTLLKTKKGGN